MIGAYITIGILIMVILLMIFLKVYPKLKQYKFMIKKIEPSKRRKRVNKKKKKSIWIKLI